MKFKDIREPDYADRLSVTGFMVSDRHEVTALIAGQEHAVTEKDALLFQGVVPLNAPAGRTMLYWTPETDGSASPGRWKNCTDDPRVIAAGILGQRLPATPDGQWLPPLPYEQAVEICRRHRADLLSKKTPSNFI